MRTVPLLLFLITLTSVVESVQPTDVDAPLRAVLRDSLEFRIRYTTSSDSVLVHPQKRTVQLQPGSDTPDSMVAPALLSPRLCEDCVRITLIAEAINVSGQDVAFCGLFDYAGSSYTPSSETKLSKPRKRLPTWIIVDHVSSDAFECRPISVRPGVAYVDTFQATYHRSSFRDTPGTLEMVVSFWVGDSAGTYSTAKCVGRNVARVSVPVP